MASKCSKCNEPVIWAVVGNGKDAGKNRPFDVNPTDTGRYGLKETEDVDKYGKQVLSAKYYEDFVEGMAENDKLYSNHFVTCSEKGSYKKAAPAQKISFSGDGLFVTVQVGDDDYAGTIQKVVKDADASPF